MKSVLIFSGLVSFQECSLPFTVNSGYGQVATASIPVARPKQICCKKHHEGKLSLQITQICRDEMFGGLQHWDRGTRCKCLEVHPVTTISLGFPTLEPSILDAFSAPQKEHAWYSCLLLCTKKRSVAEWFPFRRYIMQISSDAHFTNVAARSCSSAVATAHPSSMGPRNKPADGASAA